MPVPKTIRPLLGSSIPFLSPSLNRGLRQMVQALLTGQVLNSATLGRNLNSKAYAKHRIKTADRFINNPRVWRATLHVYRALVQKLNLQGPTPILIDWVNVGFRYDVFVAALPVDGRALPIYAAVYVRAFNNTPLAHQRGLDDLQLILPKNCQPILITDAGFSANWIRQVQAKGWRYIARVRFIVQVRFIKGSWARTGWIYNKHLHSWANEEVQDLGPADIVKTKPLRTHLMLSRARVKKGRVKKGARGRKLLRKEETKHRVRESEPWLLATNLPNVEEVMRLYGLRMQIEEAFRELKSYRFGFSLRASGSRSQAALSVLLMLGSVGSFYVLILGLGCEHRGLQSRLQANSTKSRRVLSLNFLGRLLMSTDCALLELLPPYYVCLGLLRLQIRRWPIHLREQDH